MLIAPTPIAEHIRTIARQFIDSLMGDDFGYVWNHMLTLDAIRLISLSALPSSLPDKDVEELLKGATLDEIAFSFQQDTKFGEDEVGIRTAFFQGLKGGLDAMGWLEGFADDANYTFLGESSGILVADTAVTSRPLMLPVVDVGGLNYKIDLEAIAAFSMVISPRRLHQLATKALELGEKRSSLSLYNLASQLGPAYARVKELMWDHPLVGRLITAERREELQSGYGFTLLAAEMVKSLQADPELVKPPVDVGIFLEKTFKGYSQIPDVEIDEMDLERLMTLPDDTLRLAIAKVMVGVDRVEVEREARKPHTSAEIADMEILVRHDNELFHLLIPVKSGQEIRSKSVPVEVFYQILRPHMFFQKGVVVFITARPCSQALHNYMKQARDRLGWPIGVIEERDLARLLKFNGRL